MSSQADWEVVKIAFTAAALGVSLISLWMSSQTKRRIESENFEDLKSDTVKLMRKNMASAEALSHDAEKHRVALEDAANDLDWVRMYVVGHLTRMEAITLARAYTAEDVLALPNTSENREKVRYLLNCEYTLEIMMAHGLYRQIMDEAAEMTAELKKRRTAS